MCSECQTSPRDHFWNGVWFGYPLCCVLQYALGAALGVREQAIRRGIVDLGQRPNGEHLRWVPCRFHQLRHPRWRPYASYPGVETL